MKGCVNRTWIEDADADTVAGPLGRHRFRQRRDVAFAGIVGGLKWPRNGGAERRHIENSALLTRPHSDERVLHQARKCCHVKSNELIDFSRCVRIERTREPEASIVDQNVEIEAVFR